MAKKAETRLQVKIRKALEKEFGGFWFKVHGGPFQRAGLPDLLGWVDGLSFGLEVKTPDPKSKPDLLQLVTLNDMRKAGALVNIVETVDEAISFVREAGRLPTRSREIFADGVWDGVVLRTGNGQDLGDHGGHRGLRRVRRSPRSAADQYKFDLAEESNRTAIGLVSAQGLVGFQELEGGPSDIAGTLRRAEGRHQEGAEAQLGSRGLRRKPAAQEKNHRSVKARTKAQSSKA